MFAGVRRTLIPCKIYKMTIDFGEVVDFDNHLMDAARYASFQFSRSNGWDYD